MAGEEERQKKVLEAAEQNRQKAVLEAEKKALIDSGAKEEYLSDAITLASQGLLGENINTVNEAWNAYQKRYSVLFDKEKENEASLRAADARMNANLPQPLNGVPNLSEGDVNSIFESVFDTKAENDIKDEWFGRK